MQHITKKIDKLSKSSLNVLKQLNELKVPEVSITAKAVLGKIIDFVFVTTAVTKQW